MKTGTNPYTPDPNRSTAVNFVHVNDRLLYIVDWRMVVVKGGMSWSIHPCKKGGGIVREGKCPGYMSVGEMLGSGVVGGRTVPGGQQKRLIESRWPAALRRRRAPVGAL